MDLIGTTLSKYEIIERIGRGATAFVYKARNRELEDSLVALKVLHPHQAQTDNFTERFEREARIVSRLSHPHILPIDGYGQDQGLNFMALKYVEGGTLKARLKAGLPTLDEIAHLLDQIGAALDYAHKRGIIHRDVKPSNILLAGNHLYLTDFGLTKVLTEEDDDLTATGMGLGTPTYISPEQGQGEAIDHHADIYSLGIILYQMLTGKPPFTARSPMATIFKHIHSPPRSPLKANPALPATIEPLIYRVLAKSPSDRYHSGAELAQAFRVAMQGEMPDGLPAVTNRAVKPQARPTSLRLSESGSDAISAPSYYLPGTAATFVGRAQEISRIADYLTDSTCRILSVVGPGGIGKTCLAIRAAHVLAGNEAGQAFGHGIYFVALSPLSAVDQLVPAIAAAIKFDFYGGEQSPKEQLLSYVREKEMLLLLDSFEHLLAGVTLVAEILDQAPKVKILVTSRERLNLRDEWVLEISGLSYPDQAGPTGLEQFEAVQLFLQNARRSQPGNPLPEEEITDVIRICQLVEGMPLALELASSWTRLLSCREIVAEIEQNLDFLSTSLQDLPERHRSLRSVFEYSWGMLSEAEQDVFRKLSVFRGGFQREAAEQVAGASLVLLSGLMDKSFMRRMADGQLQIHEVLRQFGEEKLQQDAETLQAARHRHGQYYADFLQKHEKHLREQRQRSALKEMSEEIENILAAWNWMIDQGQTANIGKALDSLYHFYVIRSWLQEGAESFGRAAARVREVEGMMHAFEEESGAIYSRLLVRQGQFYYRLNDYGMARELLQKGMIISQHVNAPAETALSLNSLGNIAYRLGETEEAKLHYAESMAIFQSLDDPWGTAVAKNSLGVVIHELGGQAGHLFEDSLEIFKSLGDRWGMANSLSRLGTVAYAQGRYEEAEQFFEESLAIYAELADQYGIARSLDNLGRLAYATGNYPEARRLYQESLHIFNNIGDRWGQARALSHLGDIARVLSELDSAQDLFRQSLSICQAVDNQREMAVAQSQLGRIAFQGGDFQEARRLYHQSLSICLTIGNHWGILTAFNQLGQVAASMEDFPAARQYFTHAIHTAKEMKALPHILTNLVSMAGLMARTGAQAEAVTLLSVLDEHLEESSEITDEAGHLLAALQDNLPAEAFAEAWQYGQDKLIEDVVKEILAAALPPLALED
jgi:serine/threonine protein kinase/predicted ATPase/Flp pilus assembly protein TadD